MTQPIVRPLTREDHAGWLELWAGYNAFYGREGATALPAHIVEATWARLFEPGEPVRGLVAELDGELVGLAHYIFQRSTILIAPTCYMQDLFTSPAARGQGIGRRLIEAVYESARAAGSASVYWHTHAGNGTARRLYDQVATDTGFVVYRHIL